MGSLCSKLWAQYTATAHINRHTTTAIAHMAQQPQTTTDANAQAFRFSDLIPELRNAVYTMALSSDTPIHMRESTANEPAQLCALTQASHAIRSECLLLFYAVNTFYVPVDNEPSREDSEFADYVHALDTPNVASIRSLCVDKYVMTCEKHRKINGKGNWEQVVFCSINLRIDESKVDVVLTQSESQFRRSHDPLRDCCKTAWKDTMTRVAEAVFWQEGKLDVTARGFEGILEALRITHNSINRLLELNAKKDVLARLIDVPCTDDEYYSD